MEQPVRLLDDDTYYEIEASDVGIEGAARAYGVTDPDVIAQILETHALLEKTTPSDLSIGQVYDAFALATGEPNGLREKMIGLAELHTQS